MYRARAVLQRLRPSSGVSLRDHSRWLAQWRAWRRCVEARSVSDRSGPCTAIVATYHPARYANIDPLIRCLRTVPSIGRIVVSHHNPDHAIGPWIWLRDDSVAVVQHAQRRFAAWRWQVARETGAPFVLVIDDDIFPYPEDLEKLCRALQAHPDVPHGIFGQRQMADGSYRYAVTGSGTVDILNRVYACSQEHLRRFFIMEARLPAQVRRSVWHDNLCDDVLISMTGDGQAQLHDARYFDCPTQGVRHIASWRATDFFARREQCIHALRACRDQGFS